MENIIKGLYVGSDKDVPTAKARMYALLCVCKDGDSSHRSMLGYTTMGAPEGKNYLSAREGDTTALNVIDVDDPDMIPDEALDIGLEFIHEMQKKGRILLVHCNAGHSRSATLVLMYLRAIGEMPDSFIAAERKFSTLYPPYDPGVGMRSHARMRWKTLPTFFSKG